MTAYITLQLTSESYRSYVKVNFEMRNLRPLQTLLAILMVASLAFIGLLHQQRAFNELNSVASEVVFDSDVKDRPATGK